MKGRPAWPNAQHLVFRRANSMREETHLQSRARVSALHGWGLALLTVIQCEEPQSSSASRFTAGAFAWKEGDK
jgi:hypothetical protein